MPVEGEGHQYTGIPWVYRHAGISDGCIRVLKAKILNRNKTIGENINIIS